MPWSRISTGSASRSSSIYSRPSTRGGTTSRGSRPCASISTHGRSADNWGATEALCQRERTEENLMAHNLHNGRMAYVGETPWHELGRKVPPTVSASEMIGAAGLAWKVDARPASGARLI